jgi:hypothetical protein
MIDYELDLTEAYYARSVDLRLIDLFELLLELEAKGFALEQEPNPDGIELIQSHDLLDFTQQLAHSPTAPTDEAALSVLRAFHQAANHFRECRGDQPKPQDGDA